MNIAFDAINIKSGGGIKHIKELINYRKDNRNIIIWGNKKVLKQIPNKKYLKKIYKPLFENYFITFIWKLFFFRNELKKNKCKVVVLLSGWGFVGNAKSISVFQNMLPFSESDLQKYNFSFFKLKMIVLKLLLIYSFSKANGIIFLSNFAKDEILKRLNKVKYKVIHHGITIQKKIRKIKKNNISLLYVSETEPYKNHTFLINGIDKLKVNEKVKIYLIGQKGNCHKNVEKKIFNFNNDNKNIKIYFLGPKNQKILKSYYLKSDGMIFASTCENFPNIILEGMSYNLPILCPNIGPLNEIIGKNDYYYNYNNVNSLRAKMIKLIKNNSLRKISGNRNFLRAKKYNWIRTSKQTFNFIENLL